MQRYARAQAAREAKAAATAAAANPPPTTLALVPALAKRVIPPAQPTRHLNAEIDRMLLDGMEREEVAIALNIRVGPVTKRLVAIQQRELAANPIQWSLADAVKDAGATGTDLIKKLVDQANGDVTRLLPPGHPLIQQIRDSGTGPLIKKLRFTTRTNEAGEHVEIVDVELYNAQTAAMSLVNMLVTEQQAKAAQAPVGDITVNYVNNWRDGGVDR